MNARVPVAVLLVLCRIEAESQTGRPLTLDDMFNIRRVSSPALSPDGGRVVYTVTVPSLKENRDASDLWMITTDGKDRIRLTEHRADDSRASWSPDGKRVAFESTRTGKSQIWILNAEGGEPVQFTTLSTGAKQPVWSPDGKHIAFVSEVFPEFSHKPFAESEPLNRTKLDELENGNVKAKVITGLLYRHWNEWVDGKRRHIFLQPVNGGDPRDLTPGNRDAVPTSSTFSAGIDYAFSPDGSEIAYTATPADTREEAWSTNHDIYTVPVSGGAPKQITHNVAADGYPRYSPDGRYLAYRAQEVAGFEADRWQLMLYERTTGKLRSLTDAFDISVKSPAWSPSGKMLFFEAEEEGEKPIFSVSPAGNDVRKIYGDAVNTDINTSSDGAWLVFSHQSSVRPTEVCRVRTDGRDFTRITDENSEFFSQLDIPEPESIWYEGDGGTRVQAWIFKPSPMVSGKKYPLVYLVHGGPQSAWLNSWSFRWNPALWAAQGYVVMAPNPRGSTGFGQQFTNEISGDWGGKVFVDLMKGVDFAESLPYVDKDWKAAAGASYGGYMMNWFQAKAGGRFKTLVTHCGVYNFHSMYGTTEEVWFDEWDHGGTPWDDPAGFEKFSPHRFAENFNTPNLIIHNELDFRVPFSEGMQLFTTLQRRGIPSKMLYFPDEGHWVNKPANSQLWHLTVFEWLKEYLTPGDIVQ